MAKYWSMNWDSPSGTPRESQQEVEIELSDSWANLYAMRIIQMLDDPEERNLPCTRTKEYAELLLGIMHQKHNRKDVRLMQLPDGTFKFELTH